MDVVEEVFSTENAVIAQCDRRELFILEFYDKVIEFKLCDLIAFKKKINDIDLIELFKVDQPDVSIVYLSHCDELLVLSLYQILEFRKLLNGTFHTLALNSQVHRLLRECYLKG